MSHVRVCIASWYTNLYRPTSVNSGRIAAPRYSDLGGYPETEHKLSVRRCFSSDTIHQFIYLSYRGRKHDQPTHTIHTRAPFCPQACAGISPTSMKLRRLLIWWKIW
jgi:hypothetical protein